MSGRTRMPRVSQSLEVARRTVMVLCGVLVGCAARTPSPPTPADKPARLSGRPGGSLLDEIE